MTSKSEVSGVEGSRFLSIEVIDETESTNVDLLRAAENGALEGAVLVANHQTAGRGRQGRSWLDQPGASLLVSWLLRPDPETAGLIPLLTGMAIADALSSYSDAIGVKWPNDILARQLSVDGSGSEKKLVGILCEATTTGGFAVVVGMGMNISFVSAPPPEVADKAIDLATVVGGPSALPDRSDLLRSILANADARMTELEAGNAASLLDDYRSRCVTLGREVEMETPGGVLTGTAVDIDPSGGLVIESDGQRHVVTAGDAHHRS